MSEPPKKGENPKFDQAIWESGYALTERELHIAWTFGVQGQRRNRLGQELMREFVNAECGINLCNLMEERVLFRVLALSVDEQPFGLDAKT